MANCLLLVDSNTTPEGIAATNAEINRLNFDETEYEAAIAALESEKRMNYFQKIYLDL